MAKSEYISGIAQDAAEAAIAAWESDHRYPHLSIDEKGRIEMYSGNSAERAACREFIQRHAAGRKQAATDEPRATPRQVAYLESLIERDPAAAMQLNISAEMLKGLTKSEAGRCIDRLTNY